MESIGVRELKERTSEILRRVRENGESYAVYVAVARRLNLPWVTWDQELQSRAGVVKVMRP
jgi:predicted nucleic acid-binding protein